MSQEDASQTTPKFAPEKGLRKRAHLRWMPRWGVPHPQVTAFARWGGEGIGAEEDEEGGGSEKKRSVCLVLRAGGGGYICVNSSDREVLARKDWEWWVVIRRGQRGQRQGSVRASFRCAVCIKRNEKKR
jgi:hypothetical protein